MNRMMAPPTVPQAPEPQEIAAPANAMMGGGGGQNAMMPAMPGAGASQGGFAPAPPQGAPGPPAAPQPPQPAPPTKEKIDEARKHADAMVDGLLSLTKMPAGSLTKKDVFAAASDMIAKGAFPTPSSKQALVSELASMPDDEPGIRKVLGQFLLQVAAGRAKLLAVHGPGDLAPATPGPPSAGAP